MIEKIVELLNCLDFYNANENIQFAKGAYKYPTTFKETIKQNYRWLLRKL